MRIILLLKLSYRCPVDIRISINVILGSLCLHTRHESNIARDFIAMIAQTLTETRRVDYPPIFESP